MSLDKKLIGLGPAAGAGRSSDLGSDPFSDGNCILWIDFESSIEDETGTQTLTANGSIALTTDQVMFETTSGYFDSTGVKNISGKDSITFPAGDSGLSDLDGWTNSDDFSLSVWVYWEGLNNPSSEQQGVGSIAAITNGTGIMCRIYFADQSDANKPALSSYADGIIGDTALNVDAWNHLVFISPATNSSTEAAEIYLNGVRVAYETDWDRSSRNYYDSIGSTFNTVNNNSQYFNGYMDNLRMFKDRLTASEVLSLYNEGLSGVTSMDYLIVAGGGGGGRASGTNTYYPSAGGGAGGLRTSYGSTSGTASSPEPSLNLEPGTYTITVGAGSGANSNTNGVDSSIQTPNTTYLYGTITSSGGGVGARANTSSFAGNSGGSGGGGGQAYRNPGNGIGGQGFAGGGQRSTDGGGGGGGAGEKGSKDGGDGVAVNILSSSNASTYSVGEVSGSDVYYAGGGGGGSVIADPTKKGLGGLGGGGTGASRNGADGGASPSAGVSNTGGGGGAGGSTYYKTGQAGGSGVVILRMPTSVYSGTTTGSPTVVTEGSDTVLVYKSSGTYVHS